MRVHACVSVCIYVCARVCVHEQLRPDMVASRQPRQQTEVLVLAVSRPVTASLRAPPGVRSTPAGQAVAVSQPGNIPHQLPPCQRHVMAPGTRPGRACLARGALEGPGSQAGPWEAGGRGEAVGAAGSGQIPPGERPVLAWRGWGHDLG